MQEKNFENKEAERFNWRDYLTNADKMPSDLAEKLDELTELVNGGGEGGEFLKDVNKFHEPLKGMLNFFSDILKPEERKEMWDALELCGPSRDKPGRYDKVRLIVPKR